MRKKGRERMGEIEQLVRRAKKRDPDAFTGSAVDGLANAQAGDLICYSGHVALYIGNGQIVHASTAKTGIIVSNADYKKVLAVRRIF